MWTRLKLAWNAFFLKDYTATLNPCIQESILGWDTDTCQIHCCDASAGYRIKKTVMEIKKQDQYLLVCQNCRDKQIHPEV